MTKQPKPKPKANKLREPFMWRDCYGTRHSIRSMETRHLFYTLRMIWNHSMPEAAKLKPYHQYTHFSETYTNAYMKQVVEAMLPELMLHDNLTAEWKWELHQMGNWLKTGHLIKPINLLKIENP